MALEMTCGWNARLLPGTSLPFCNFAIRMRLLCFQTAYDDSEINGLQAGIDSDADTDDDIGSFHDDGPDSSEQECGDDDGETVDHGKSKDRDLEWDSSTVTY